MDIRQGSLRAKPHKIHWFCPFYFSVGLNVRMSGISRVYCVLHNNYY